MEVDAPFKISLEIDQDDVFDYENRKFSSEKINLEYLKESFMIEVNLIQERGQKYGGSH
jgi:hypothetical protein